MKPTVNDQVYYKIDMRAWQLLERIWWKGLEGSFRAQELPSRIQLRLESFRRQGVHDFLWEFILVWDYPNAEGMLATPGFTPLFGESWKRAFSIDLQMCMQLPTPFNCKKV